ncbi:MAG TPA: hypothetical protein VFT59_01045 [Candidatus Saccharimonadales bacterium]|nr:hypothetical protein [Candidatus Saccharimonadales bacterium]
MGGGSWNVGAYEFNTAAKKAAGKPTFDYDAALRSSVPYDSWRVHEDLDPSRLNSLGVNVREARDSAEHPNATPIAVIFDVTGSMGGIPMVLQQKLPQLHGILQRKGYVEDPQILFGAVGDAYSDRVPLQIGQFESDNRMDAQLEHIVLEGGGGGGNHESYQLAAYYMAYHTELDCLNRGKKGYLFIIGDERVYSRIDRRQVQAIIGDELQEDLSTEQVFEVLKSKFHVFFLFAIQGSYRPEDVLIGPGYDDGNVCYWRNLLGQNALLLEDASAVCETIALTLGVMEGTVSLDEGMEDLYEAGVDQRAIAAAGKALAPVGSGSSVAKSSGTLPDVLDDGDTGTTRL